MPRSFFSRTPSGPAPPPPGTAAKQKPYDPGYANTRAYKSAITLSNGQTGTLRYRGFPIEQLAVSSSFDEVAYLLLYKQLPNREALDRFRSTLARPDRVILPDTVTAVIRAFPRDAHPMTILVAALSAFTAANPKLNPSVAGSSVYDDGRARADVVLTVLSGMPVLAVAILHHTLPISVGAGSDAAASAQKAQVASDAAMATSAPSYVRRFLRAGFGGGVAPVLERAIDTLFLLHADHELNCSTAAVRHLASSGVDAFSAMAAGAAALYGPLHGGACEAVVHMLGRIATPDAVPAFLEGVKKREERLMGFGHRIYKTYDPRAKVVRGLAHAVLRELGAESDDLIRVATALERAALADRYFTERKLYPNVDFYSGIIYKAMGLEPPFFTVMFAMGRCVGWLAHWLEFLDDKDKRIVRPHQWYVGDVGPMEVPLLDERKMEEDANVMGGKKAVIAAKL